MPSLRPTPRSSRPHETGFSVIELTISLAVTVLILLAVLQIFDFSSKLSRVQSNVSDMQQTQRIVHYELTKQIRMAGRGGLTTGDLPQGSAIAVADNVPAGTTIGGLGTPTVVEGSDVLTIRGNFSGDVYSVDFRDQVAPSFTYSAVTGLGTLRVDSQFGVVAQSLEPLAEAIDNNRPEALLLVSSRNTNTYVTVELDPTTSSVSRTPAPESRATTATLGFRFTGGTNTGSYGTFSSAGAGVFPDIPAVARVSIVEEYRYYLREEREIPGDNTSELVRRLTRARTYPGTSSAYGGSASNWSEDLADNVLDLQIALGVNTPAGCLLTPGDDTTCAMTETANGLNDDWLYNDSQAIVPATWRNADLYYLRMSTLVRTDKRDATYQAPPIAKIENHDYTALPANTSTNDRKFRRRVLQTVIDLRNV